MGLKNGKYNFQHATSLPNLHQTLPRSPSDLPTSKANKKARKTEISLPRFLHRDALIDSSTTRPENLSLVWLDTNLYQRASNIDTEIKLKNLTGYIRVFDRVDTCERYIKQIGRMNNNEHIRKEKLLVIISTALAPTLIPHLHDLTQVKSIYVFGKAKTISKAHQEWIRKFPKVKGVFTSSRLLIAQITQDQN